MGCGNSKFDANGVAIPQRFRPIFHGRLDEIRRRHAGKLKDETPSKKELLLHDEDDSSSHQPLVNNAMKGESLCSPEDNVSCVTSEGSKGDHNSTTKHQDEARREAKSREERSIDNFRKDGEGKLAEEMTRERAKMKNGTDADIEDEGEDDDDDDDDDHDGRMLRRNQDDEYVHPGSPSFRVYFSENLQDQRLNDGYISSDKDNGLQETATAPSEVIATFEESAPKKVKKERKRRSIRKVLPKGFNVRSCYSSAHSSHDQAHLLTGKAPAT